MKNTHFLLAAVLAVGALSFGDVTNPGLNDSSVGYVADQTVLLQTAVDGLAVYNSAPDPVIENLTQLVTLETIRVPQAPKSFSPAGEGARTGDKSVVYRKLNTPLLDYELSSEFTVQWLQDALPSDITTEMEAAMKGDAELLEALFFGAMFTKITPGTVAAAYQASFYNGETDVPHYKNNAFSSAHYHYKGINSTTLTSDIWEEAKQDIIEHGFGRTPGSLEAKFHSSDLDLVIPLANSSSTILQAITAMREKAIDGGILNNGVMISGVWVTADDNVPPGYFCMYDRFEKIMNRRVHKVPAYQGLQLFRKGSEASPEYPLSGMHFFRRVGFSARQLGACTCRQIVASTTYTNPTFRHEALN